VSDRVGDGFESDSITGDRDVHGEFGQVVGGLNCDLESTAGTAV
jgi:hypothetical protein